MTGIVWGLVGVLVFDHALIAFLIRSRYVRATIGPESAATERRRRLARLPLVQVIPSPSSRNELLASLPERHREETHDHDS